MRFTKMGGKIILPEKVITVRKDLMQFQEKMVKDELFL